MATRTGSAVWEGTLKEGRGTMKLGSGAFDGPYSFLSRFESGKGTNPEELIGAAEAGCFSMALAFNLEKAGHPAKRVSTTATVKLEPADGGFKITSIDLKTEADVPGIDEAKFREQAELTKKTCPACSRNFASRSEEHTSELQSLAYLVCRLLLEKKKKNIITDSTVRINMNRSMNPNTTQP